MELLHAFWLLLGGCVAGLLAGFFGVGGGLLLVPILLFYYQAVHVTSLVSTHMALATSLLIVVCSSISSAVQYQRNGHVVWKAVVLLGITSVIGGLLGAMLAGGMEPKTLRQIFAGVVAFAAVRMFMEIRKAKIETMPPLFAPPLLGTGFVVGVLSALAGVGGGVLSIPVMHSILKFPLKKALGTSSATIVITAFAAAVGYMIRGWSNVLVPAGTLGYVDWLTALPLVVGSIPMAAVGANLANRTKVQHLKQIFAIFLLVIAMKLLFF